MQDSVYVAIQHMKEEHWPELIKTGHRIAIAEAVKKAVEKEEQDSSRLLTGGQLPAAPPANKCCLLL